MPFSLTAFTEHIWSMLPISPSQFTLGLVCALFLLLAFSSLAPDLILILGVVTLLVVGILKPADALAGLSNEGMVTVAVLYVVGAGVRETGGVDWIAKSFFGRPKNAARRDSRVVFPTIGAERVHEQHAAGGDDDSGRQRLRQDAADRRLAS